MNVMCLSWFNIATFGDPLMPGMLCTCAAADHPSRMLREFPRSQHLSDVFYNLYICQFVQFVGICKGQRQKKAP